MADALLSRTFTSMKGLSIHYCLAEIEPEHAMHPYAISAIEPDLTLREPLWGWVSARTQQ